MAKKPKFEAGQPIQCRKAVEAYYSGYGGNPKMEFTPELVGTIAAIAPKVRIYNPKDDDRFDGKDEFLVVDFVHPEHGKQRVGLNFCNAVAPTQKV